MTVKQIAKIANCSEDSVLKYGREIAPMRITPGRKTYFDDHETIDIIEKCKKTPQKISTEDSPSPILQSVIEIIPRVVAETVRQLKTEINYKPVEDPEDLPLDAQIKNIVGDYARKMLNGDYKEAYRILYEDFGSRYQINVNYRPRSNGQTGIEYIKQIGRIGELHLCAVRLFKTPA